MGRLKAETLRAYVSAIRSRHVDYGILIAAFKDPIVHRLLARAAAISPSAKKDKQPITRDILAQVVTHGPSLPDVNTDAAFTLAFAGFLRMGEITYTTAELKNRTTFLAKKATRHDITFTPSGMTFRLKWSKADKQHQGVDVAIAAVGGPLCLVAAITKLFNRDPQPLNSPLFSLNGKPFTSPGVRKILSSRLVAAGINPSSYLNHSFRRGAAQFAEDSGCSHQQIQQLGRWSSEAFRLYIRTKTTDLRRLNSHF